ncbi:MAG: Rpn family recombination-promoting nuclease/putative transposase, partial [Treponema sp.]|nr:Rpn family recombination-promoting nuclease/putative transposase [Treponema sp.]MCL2252545.1 Rpn family recombination-promoting nuclease/putative transposase [Treponema sp.]
KSGKVIHIEIQLQITPEIHGRIIFYGAKLLTEQLGDSDKYSKVNQVICIIITNETLVKKSSRYHHRFTFYDFDARIELNDIIEIHTLELSKLPEQADGTILYDWAKFIDAESEEDLKMVADRNPEVQKAVVKLMEFSADEKARYIAELRQKEQRDMRMWEDYGLEKGLAKGLEQGRTEERERWQNVVAEKDAELASQKAEIERLRALAEK